MDLLRPHVPAALGTALDASERAQSQPGSSGAGTGTGASMTLLLSRAASKCLSAGEGGVVYASCSNQAESEDPSSQIGENHFGKKQAANNLQ